MIGIFLGYLALTVALGLWQARQTRSQADFVLGSSRLPGWMLALSERATGESAWLLLGLTGFVYANGLSAIWIAVGCLTGISTSWIVLARRFRSEAERYQALTMPDYFSAKFPEKAYAIRFLSTLIIVFFFVFYVGAQFAGAGKTLHVTFGLDPFWGQVISAVAIIGYSAFGGFVSVVAVDSFQAILMILTLVVTPAVMLVKVMLGPVSIGAALAAAGGGMDSLTGTTTGFAAGVLIFNNFSWFFGYLGGQPQLNARFMGMRDDRQVRIGRNIAIVWTLLAYAGAITIGLCAIVLFGPRALADSEMVLPNALTLLFPWWMAGVLLAGAVAAMVSTAESMLIVAGTSISQDVYKGLIKKGRAADSRLLTISRVSTLVVGVLGLGLALTTEKLIYVIVSHAWAGIGCSFAPAVLLAFYWDRFTSRGVVTALVTGLITTVVWIATGLEQRVTAMAVTFFASMGAAIVATLLVPGRPREGAMKVSALALAIGLLAGTASAEVHQFTPKNAVPTFAVRPPVLTVKPGDTVVSPTFSLPGDYYEKDGGAWPGEVGPFAIEGAAPGDTLVVKILKVELNRDTAVSAIRPGGLSALATDGRLRLLNDPLPSRRFVWQLDRKRNVGILDLPGSASRRIEIPLAPMVGRVAVAPAGEEAFGGLWPGAFGGNMDVPDIREGSTVSLPVYHEGALFYFGDVHAAQGDGEVCGSGLETTAIVTMQFDLVKGKRIAWPRIEDATHIMVAGSARPLIDAFRIAHVELIDWLAADYGFDRLEAYQVVSQVGTARIGNVVDPLYTVAAKFPKALLPQRK